MGFSRQEYWSELLFHSSGDLSDPGIKPVSLVLADSLPLSYLRSPSVKEEMVVLDNSGRLSVSYSKLRCTRWWSVRRWWRWGCLSSRRAHTEFRLASPYNCASQFLKVNFSLNILVFLGSTLTSTAMIPILQMGKPRHREFRQLA